MLTVYFINKCQLMNISTEVGFSKCFEYMLLRKYFLNKTVNLIFNNISCKMYYTKEVCIYSLINQNNKLLTFVVNLSCCV